MTLVYSAHISVLLKLFELFARGVYFISFILSIWTYKQYDHIERKSVIDFGRTLKRLNLCTLTLQQCLGRARSPDLLEIGFVMVAYEKLFLYSCFGRKILTEL